MIYTSYALHAFRIYSNCTQRLKQTLHTFVASDNSMQRMRERRLRTNLLEGRTGVDAYGLGMLGLDVLFEDIYKGVLRWDGKIIIVIHGGTNCLWNQEVVGAWSPQSLVF